MSTKRINVAISDDIAERLNKLLPYSMKSRLFRRVAEYTVNELEAALALGKNIDFAVAELFANGIKLTGEFHHDT